MATLELRLTNLAQAVGADIKALTAAIAGLSNGGATIKSATINAPYGAGPYSEVISDPLVTGGSKLIVQLGSANDENDEEDLAELSVSATPIASGIRVTVVGAGLFGGPIPINYMIGA